MKHLLHCFLLRLPGPLLSRPRVPYTTYVNHLFCCLASTRIFSTRVVFVPRRLRLMSGIVSSTTQSVTNPPDVTSCASLPKTSPVSRVLPFRWTSPTINKQNLPGLRMRYISFKDCRISSSYLRLLVVSCRFSFFQLR